MPFDFICIAVVFIWCLFYLKPNTKNLFLFLGVMFMIVSYFNLNLQLFGVSFNASVILGVVCWTIFIYFRPNNINVKLVTESIVYVLVLYVGLNLISIEFNSFFNVIPLVAMSVIISLVKCRNLKSSLCIFTISNISCEIANIVLLMQKLSMAYIFCREFVVSMVIGISAIVLFYGIKNSIKVKYEKVS